MVIENKTLRGIQTRDHIMDIALNLFEKQGYEKVSVDKIVKESKTSKGSFYQHFPSKSSIFMVRFREIDDNYVQIYEELRLEYSLAIERLEAFCFAVLRCMENELGKDLIRVIYSEAIINHEHAFFNDGNRKLHKIIYRIIDEGMEDSSIRKFDSNDDLFKLIVQTLFGSIYYWGLQTNEKKLEDLGRPLITQVITSLSV